MKALCEPMVGVIYRTIHDFFIAANDEKEEAGLYIMTPVVIDKTLSENGDHTYPQHAMPYLPG